MTNSAEKILDIAERRMREAGYYQVSYRDIAIDMGIKSASIHYHFPKKSDLGQKLVQRYSENFKAVLGAKTEYLEDPDKQLAGFVDVYREALKMNNRICLCAMLGAEAPGLPEDVSLEVSRFFAFNIDWLTRTYAAMGAANPEQNAKATLSMLEGAMIIAVAQQDYDVFEAAAQFVTSE